LRLQPDFGFSRKRTEIGLAQGFGGGHRHFGIAHQRIDRCRAQHAGNHHAPETDAVDDSANYPCPDQQAANNNARACELAEEMRPAQRARLCADGGPHADTLQRGARCENFVGLGGR
jgi:hypothetical protein